MKKRVDSYRFLTTFTKKLVAHWIDMESPHTMPWTPLPKPITECTVALISSGGIALKSDPPFDQEGERRNPWWGDPSYRLIPRTATEEHVNIYHLHINPKFAEQDLNCLFPLQRLLALEARDEIGRSAPSHYSYMGYILQPQTLLQESIPPIIAQLQAEMVDVVILVPA